MSHSSTRLFHLSLALAVALMWVGGLMAGPGQVETARARPLQPPAAQQFAISFGDTVSDGVPAPGAGNTVLFDSRLQDQQLALPQTGTYILTVQGVEVNGFGIYSFALLEDVANTWRIHLPLVRR